ncbi:unnamed protein product [Zymoseptoria tritici ST99CH_1E4]|uniref:Uncharacterized protein n=1 Tax=Zymoseptoria tritici ST99CH_1E4 TaxID=1276532 RepID=A0A2H1GFP6_ZYMTR|nr:unnamed protein product [Zymoseptoria tritici ST99CH_1E4]
MQLKTYLLIAAATIFGAVEGGTNLWCHSDLPEQTQSQWCEDTFKGKGGGKDGRECCLPLGQIKRFTHECRKLPHGRWWWVNHDGGNCCVRFGAC